MYVTSAEFAWQVKFLKDAEVGKALKLESQVRTSDIPVFGLPWHTIREPKPIASRRLLRRSGIGTVT